MAKVTVTIEDDNGNSVRTDGIVFSKVLADIVQAYGLIADGFAESYLGDCAAQLADALPDDYFLMSVAREVEPKDVALNQAGAELVAAAGRYMLAYHKKYRLRTAYEKATEAK